MAPISVRELGRLARIAQEATTTTARGRAFEDLIAYAFGRVPGITLSRRDALNVFASEELDLAFWNEQRQTGFYFLPNIILVECKNWSNAVGSAEVAWFDRKLQDRSRTHGVLVAANGITGNPADASAAHDIVRGALAHGRHLIIVTQDELMGLRNTTQFARLLQEKLCELVVSGTVVLTAPAA